MCSAVDDAFSTALNMTAVRVSWRIHYSHRLSANSSHLRPHYDAKRPMSTFVERKAFGRVSLERRLIDTTDADDVQLVRHSAFSVSPSRTCRRNVDEGTAACELNT